VNIGRFGGGNTAPGWVESGWLKGSGAEDITGGCNTEEIMEGERRNKVAGAAGLGAWAESGVRGIAWVLTSWGSSRVGVWTSTKVAGPTREEESGDCEIVEEVQTQSVSRNTEARGLELDQVTVGAVEVERDSKEAET